MNTPKNRKEYVEWYYGLHSCPLDREGKLVVDFLARNVSGKVLDCGCGPVPQIWSLCMPRATEISAIDVVEESITFVTAKLATVDQWLNEFSCYVKMAESAAGILPEDYAEKQISKITSIGVADMAKDIPFDDSYFDTALSLYSLGVLNDEQELERAIENIARVLKRGGTLLHVNSNGENRNDVLPEYTWKGLPQAASVLKPILERHDFKDIVVSALDVESKSAYKYDKIYLLSATKE